MCPARRRPLRDLQLGGALPLVAPTVCADQREDSEVRLTRPEQKSRSARPARSGPVRQDSLFDQLPAVAVARAAITAVPMGVPSPVQASQPTPAEKPPLFPVVMSRKAALAL